MATVKTGGFIGRLVNRLQTWFREVTAELKRVVKPTPEETTQMMLVVIGFILIVGLWFALWDILLVKITSHIDQWVLGTGR
ncbi:Protein translocase subunit SecE [bacterium HR15]|nr:Protein translocase subunit SecE [bacterium HR15]